MRAGAPASTLVAAIKDNLRLAPASSRGWTLLSEVVSPSDKKLAGVALAQSLLLAPRDYWLAAPRLIEAANLWPDLNTETRKGALRQARLVWETPQLRAQLSVLSQSKSTAALLSRAYSEDEIRMLNRMLSRDQRKAAAR